MKHSIRVKFIVMFTGLMVAVLVSMWTVNSLSLEGSYTKQKLRLLEDAYENLDAIAADREFQGQNITEELQGLFLSDGEQTEASRLLRLMNDRYSTTIAIQDNIIGESIPLAKDSKFLADTLHRCILGIIDPRTKTLISQDDHQVQKIYDRRSQGYYFQSWGSLDDNRTVFVVSMPLASIHDSVNIPSEFPAHVGLTALVLGSALIYYATKKVISPIHSLTVLSVRMSGLDSETRCTGDSGDEIGVLGHSMNALSEKLRKAIGKLKAANNELRKDIEEKIKIDEIRKEFIVNVSHELKTPITLVQGYAEGLTEGVTEDESNRNYCCEVTMDKAGKMNKMVRQLLTLTALESGNDIPVMERFDIAALTRGILLPAGILFQQKEARVVLDQEGPVWVWADKLKTEEVITNHLDNAMNHLEGERRIEIRLEKGEGGVRITMFNTGHHIPEKDLGSL